MNLVKTIVHSGILDTDSYQKKRAILFTNYISLILSGVITILFVIRQLVYGDLPNGITISFLLVGLIFFFSAIVLNRFPMTTASRVVMCYGPVVFIWITYVVNMHKVTATQTSMYGSLRIHLLAVSFIPYLLFDNRKVFILIIAILPTLLSFIFFESIFSLLGLGSKPDDFGDDYQLVQVRTMIAYFIVSGGCFAFQWTITQNDEFNQTILMELNDKSKEVEAQNEELRQNQEQLSEINLHLENLVEKKTENIKNQNESVIKYAYANAHHVRGPVARLLGLIQLYKMETALGNAWFFEKVEHEAKVIDVIIKDIAKDLDEANAERNSF